MKKKNSSPLEQCCYNAPSAFLGFASTLPTRIVGTVVVRHPDEVFQAQRVGKSPVQVYHPATP
jgi:hypothetical protein